ncbi:acyl-CoA dehydrogenase family protein [Ancylomarina sp. 16SWW S1-10-2]|uniref:acyl-CoA dehydrogenase family protein n=1 Tax=Ancylomarina sp. 16SWW S1-10-2 TaxID=2499681 RepID=UPI0012AD226B|nr:acyl-CoA dehydrogenase family protein [Ancylomarina sp. 16SWW S1-10-2]MRT93520.1 acyl-CoA dehydrogenase [Ancylomarina sp. 16SWW S1-10-2]
MNTNFSEYIKAFEKTLKSAFHDREDINKFSSQRGLPPLAMREVMSTNPLSVAIPENYGGRGVKVKECLGILASSAYESLPLSLTFGINIGLFLEPVAKYANEIVKKDIFQRFLNKQNMGGLMITEPEYGSGALNMQTSYTEENDKFHIKGTKHWQGLTGLADYWLITSRQQNSDGRLGRDIDFFICDVTQKNQKVVVEEYYDNLGLYMIPYGKNKLDLQIPKNFKLEPETTGIKMMLDILHRSRMQFPGMGLGFVKRMMDEALDQCKNRIVAGKSLISYDQVQFQISKIQSAFTICSAFCSRSSEKSGIENNLANDGIEANSVKTIVTDLMQEAAQTLVQLSGAKGYRLSHIGGRGIVDSRPFQIFEGANEMLYTQISEMVIKIMKRKKAFNLFQFLKDFDLTSKASEYLKKQTDFSLNTELPQRKLVDLGRAISRVVSAGLVIDLGEKGFRKDLIDNCLDSLQQDISNMIFSYHNNTKINSIPDYQDGSSWLEFS